MLFVWCLWFDWWFCWWKFWFRVWWWGFFIERFWLRVYFIVIVVIGLRFFGGWGRWGGDILRVLRGFVVMVWLLLLLLVVWIIIILGCWLLSCCLWVIVGLGVGCRCDRIWLVGWYYVIIVYYRVINIVFIYKNNVYVISWIFK